MTEQPTERVVVYERVSSEKQDISRQAAQRERARADYPDAEVVVIQDEGVSAFKVSIFERPGGKQLCELIKAGRVAAVYADAQDRLSRGKQSEWWQFIDLCEVTGTRIFIDGRELRPWEDESDEIKSALDAMIARRESLNRSHRSKGGAAKMARSGRHRGPAGYGYRWEGERKEQRLIPDKATAPVVRRIYRDYLAGAGIGAIAARLTADGVPLPRKRKSGNQQWDRHTVANILDSVLYVGRIRFNGEVISEGEHLHEPLVDEATWQRVQGRRRGRRVVHGRPSGTTALLTGGLLRCGVCGAAMRARTPKDRQARYDCSTRHRSGGRVVCEMTGILASEVDDQLVRYLADYVFDVEATVDAILADHVEALNVKWGLVAQAEADVTKFDEQMIRVESHYRDGRITPEEWHEQRDAILDDRLTASQQAEQLTAEAAELAAEVDQEEARRLAAEWIAKLRASLAAEVSLSEGDVGALRAVLARTFEAITIVRVGDAVHLLPLVHEHMLRSLDPDELVQPKSQAVPGVHSATARS